MNAHDTADTLDLPPMSLPRRVREAARAAWRTLRTGRHQYAEGYLRGMRAGIDGGFAAALGEFNAVLAAQGIDPIRSPR